MAVQATPIRALSDVVATGGTGDVGPAQAVVNNDSTGNPQITEVTPEMMVALNRLLEAKPDQKAEFENRFGGDPLAYINSTLGWWSQFSDQVGDRINTDFAPEQALLKAAGFEIQGGTQPVEQDLLNRVLSDYVYPSLEQDKKNTVTTNNIVDTANRSLDDAVKLNQPFVNSGFSSAAYLNQFAPDKQAALKTTFQDLIDKGIASNADDAARYYYDNTGKAQGDKPGIIGQLGAEFGNADDVQAQLAASAQTEAAARLKALDAQKAQMTAALDANLQTRMAAIDASTGQLKAGSTALDAKKVQDLDAATAQLRAGLSQLETERTASLATLNDTRLAAAQGQVTAVNQGLERTKDQLAATSAARGFVGNSSMDDANLARAVIGARQDAANVVGGARVVNATDSRNLADAVSGQRYDITSGDATQRQGIGDTGAQRMYDITAGDAGARLGTSTDVANNRLSLEGQDATARTGATYDLASGIRSAADKGTAMKSSYFDANAPRSIGAALVPAQVATSKINLLGQAGALSNAGLTRSLANLGWFTNGATPLPSGAYNAQPVQYSNDLGGLGAGIFAGAASYGNANQWWQTPKVASNTANPGYVNSYAPTTTEALF